MHGWDYRVLRFSAATLAILEDTLRQHGADGWEAVGMVPHTSDSTTRHAGAGGLLVVLKRPLPNTAGVASPEVADQPGDEPPPRPEPGPVSPTSAPPNRPRWRFW
jgi:hypothetical protein